MECLGISLLGVLIVLAFFAAKSIWRKWVEGKVVDIADSLEEFDYTNYLAPANFTVGFFVDEQTASFALIDYAPFSGDFEVTRFRSEDLHALDIIENGKSVARLERNSRIDSASTFLAIREAAAKKPGQYGETPVRDLKLIIEIDLGEIERYPLAMINHSRGYAKGSLVHQENITELREWFERLKDYMRPEDKSREAPSS
jgi:hypothetical protein